MAANPSIQLGTDGNWAIKEDNLLAYKKDGTRFFNKEFDFSRNSLATFVDKDGLIKVSGVTDTELVVNGDFATDSDWLKFNNATISNGVAILSNTSGSVVQQGLTTEVGKKYKIKIDIQGIGNDYYLCVGSGVGTGLTNRNILHSQSLSAIFTATGTLSYVGVRNNSNLNTYTINNISVVEVQTDVPRIDFKNDTTGHLLLEPQSTNLITYSEDFSDSYWRKDKLTVIPNSITSPTGELNASLIKEISYTSSIPSIDINNPSSLGTGTYTFSFYVKNNNGRYLGISFGSSSERVRTNFDFNTNTFKVLNLSGSTTATASFTTLGNFYRISITATFPSATVADAVLMPLATDTYPFFAFQDSDNRSFYLWGAQVEQKSYATSYIPTYDSTVTRNAEVCNNSGSVQDFNSEEGVLYAEIAALANDLTNRYITLSDGTSNNRLIIRYSNGNNNLLNAQFRVGGSAQADINKVLSDITISSKVAFKFKQNDFALWVDGVEAGVDTSGSVPSVNTFNQLSFTDATGGVPFYGKTKNIKVFKRALSDAELQKLTT